MATCVPLSFISLPTPLTVADRLALVLDGLCKAVAARSFRQAMAEVMILLVWTRVRRIERQLQGLLARFLQGRLVVRVSSRTATAGSGGGGGPVPLPRSFGWLLPMVPYQAAGFASQLQVVLAEPEMVALLAVAPQARRVVAPLCRMLGIVLAPVSPGGGGSDAPEGAAARDGRVADPGGVGRATRGMGGDGPCPAGVVETVVLGFGVGPPAWADLEGAGRSG
jgi:hypothetical protein